MWPLMILSALKKAGAFLLTYWKEVVICLMVVTIVYDNFATKRYFFGADTIPYLKADNARLTSELKIAADANKTLTNDITGLNSVVGDWEAKSKQLVAQNAQLQTKLNQKGVIIKQKVDKILAAPTPKDCEDSVQFLRDTQKQLTWSAQ